MQSGGKYLVVRVPASASCCRLTAVLGARLHEFPRDGIHDVAAEAIPGRGGLLCLEHLREVLQVRLRIAHARVRNELLILLLSEHWLAVGKGVARHVAEDISPAIE